MTDNNFVGISREEEYSKIMKQLSNLYGSLEDMIKEMKMENPNLDSSYSFGNYDDVFYDGFRQGEYEGREDCIKKIREILDNN